jgi:hypothetical protein
MFGIYEIPLLISLSSTMTTMNVLTVRKRMQQQIIATKAAAAKEGTTIQKGGMGMGRSVGVLGGRHSDRCVHLDAPQSHRLVDKSYSY